MLEADEAFTQVLTWRVNRLQVRVAQVLVVGALSWMAIGWFAVAAWMAAATGAALIDWRLCRRLLAQPNDPRALALVCASLIVSASAFSLIALPFLARSSHAAVAETALLLCAINLNNAIMTRASRLGTGLILGPSAVVLMATPLAANLFGQHLSRSDIALLEVGAVGYLVFLARLAATLRDEGQTIRRALQDQDQLRRRAEIAMGEAVQSRSRWRMLFDQSPLPQTCFDACRMYALLKPHIDAGETRLGDVAGLRFGATCDALQYVKVIDRNEAAEVLFGLEQLADRIDADRFADSFLRGFREGLNGMDDDGVLAPFETTVLRPNGDTTEVRVHVRMPPGQQPPWSLCMVSYVDVTEQHHATRAQQAAVEAAEAANHAKSEFLAVMSHEIRTPLNGVLGMAQAMELEPLSPVQKERLGVIRQSGGALLAILNDVLDLSKIEAGKLELEIADFDLAAVTRAAQAAFGAVAARKGLSLDVEITPDADGLWRGDAVRVRQVIYNLVENAVKFTESGAVMIRVEALASGVRVAVHDTGIGIAADRVSTLFEKFVQADSSTTRRFGGTGLGLAICRELSNAMGGSISAESENGEGSVFVVELPLAPAAPAAAAAAPAAASAPSPGAALRVLAAEDNVTNQLVLRTLLAQVGVDPMIVSNGAEAVAAFEQGSWDLILMDVQMPLMDGPSAARAIRAREAQTGAAPTPIVALTANAMSHQIAGYLAAGMNDILAKPIEVAQLYQALAAAAPEARQTQRSLKTNLR
jgi:signal transduction histidine kinase/AmiR/NasT family two-component response regulator